MDDVSLDSTERVNEQSSAPTGPRREPREVTVLALDDLQRCGSIRAFRRLCVASESARDLPRTTEFALPKKR